MADELVLSSVKLPNNRVYYFKDSYAREAIKELSSYCKYLGVTTSPLYDGATTNPIIINGDQVYAVDGGIAIHDQSEFIYNEAAGCWQLFGDLSGLTDLLGSFAYTDTGSVSILPKGSINAVFVGEPGTISVEYTPSGTISATLASTTGTIDVSGVPQGIVEIAEIVKSITGNYQPTGTISNTVDVSVNTTTTSINQITSVGTLPTFVVNTSNGGILDASIGNDSEQLVLYYNSAMYSFSQGTLPSISSVDIITDVSVDVDVSSTFIGDSVSIGATFSGSNTTFSGSYEISGDITAEFTGTSATISTSFTPSGSISATFSGTSETYITTAPPKPSQQANNGGGE